MKLSMIAALFSVMVANIGCDSGCDVKKSDPVSTSGVSKATVKVPVGPDGLTTEQRNIRERLLKDNEPGSIKHLYVISAYSGQVLIYSTVKGKVTSGGKRLTPSTIVGGYTGTGYYGAFPVQFGNDTAFTNEVLQDDGAYGSSMDYLYWFDQNGVYHQHYVQGGQIVHVSSQPIAVKNIVLNMELNEHNDPSANSDTKTTTKPQDNKHK